MSLARKRPSLWGVVFKWRGYIDFAPTALIRLAGTAGERQSRQIDRAAAGL